MARISNSGASLTDLQAARAADRRARDARAAVSRADAQSAAARRKAEILSRLDQLRAEAERLETQAAGPACWGAVGSLGHLETVLGQLLGMEG